MKYSYINESCCWVNWGKEEENGITNHQFTIIQSINKHHKYQIMPYIYNNWETFVCPEFPSLNSSTLGNSTLIFEQIKLQLFAFALFILENNNIWTVLRVNSTIWIITFILSTIVQKNSIISQLTSMYLAEWQRCG